MHGDIYMIKSATDCTSPVNKTTITNDFTLTKINVMFVGFAWGVLVYPMGTI